MYKIAIDNKGYYTEEDSENIVEVEEMPYVESVSDLFAYKYDKDKKILIVDNDKLNDIKSSQSTGYIEPTTEERLTAIESAIDELASIIGGE